VVVRVVFTWAAAVMVAHLMFGDISTIVAALNMHGVSVGFSPLAA
jgi:glycerol uptake facilitator-like aquaporin